MAAVGRIVRNKEETAKCTEGETVHKTIIKHRVDKIENKHTKQEQRE